MWKISHAVLGTTLETVLNHRVNPLPDQRLLEFRPFFADTAAMTVRETPGAISNRASEKCPLFSIVTPSFKQLDWLRLCVASVRDQVEGEKLATGKLRQREARSSNGQALKPETHTEFSTGIQTQVSSLKAQVSPPLRVEHIIQDAGSPGIEDFARENGAALYRDGSLVCAASSALPGYTLTIYCERDAGMYDAINRGLAKSTGEICAWLNSDEQYLERTLAKVAALFEKTPALDVLLGDALLVDANLQPVCYRRIMIPNRWHTRLDHLHSLSCAMFFRPAALPSPPMDPRWKVIGDAVLMDYFLGSGKKLRACGVLLAAYAFTGQNLSANPTHCEHELWLKESSWPPTFLRGPVVLYNRLRRAAHGAYRSFPVRPGLFTPSSRDGRIALATSVSGLWPGACPVSRTNPPL